MLFVCCFCDHVRDESTGAADPHMSVMCRTPRRRGIVVSYTCCQACLQNDPRAITFRTRRNKPHCSGPAARVWGRQSVAA
jgi:hypothetical protein